MAPVSLHQEDGPNESMAVIPYLKSMTWVMENNNSVPGNRLAVINLKLQDYSKTHSELEVKFRLSRPSLEPMLRSMTYISEQLSTPASRVAVINLKLHDTETTSGESEVKFQVSRDTLGAMLRSMAYIQEQLSNAMTGIAQHSTDNKTAGGQLCFEDGLNGVIAVDVIIDELASVNPEETAVMGEAKHQGHFTILAFPHKKLHFWKFDLDKLLG
ncbi:hypothetical protein HS088_TW07G00539 [Tripterygium wilfordii]|uniref:Uncharacterized protein n=1 Tax=Tripterygium wilfordii TaxID=458696 RepID=A0A7J7DFA5_TRIWF|nr:hypothetical protein HS088_TW07G00539 [Tripterygium wilfordii]